MMIQRKECFKLEGWGLSIGKSGWMGEMNLVNLNVENTQYIYINWS